MARIKVACSECGQKSFSVSNQDKEDAEGYGWYLACNACKIKIPIPINAIKGGGCSYVWYEK